MDVETAAGKLKGKRQMSVLPVKAGAMNQKLGLWVPRWQQVE